MDPTLLDLATAGGPWAWAVLIAGVLLWVPHLGLSVMAATGRRIPTASFLLLVLFLFVLAVTGAGFGWLELQADMARVSVGDKIRTVGQGLEAAWIPIILAGRLTPVLCSGGALAVAIGAWLRGPDTRFTATYQGIAPAILGLLAVAAGAAVDTRIALAAGAATVALTLVSLREDDDPDQRRRLAARRARVAVLALTGVSLALCAAVASSIARADGILALDDWPQAAMVAFYTPTEVLQRHAVLPAGLAPVGLAGLAGLASVFPLATRLGGARTWIGAASTGLVMIAFALLGVGIANRYGDTWAEVIPPRTHVAVPRVDRAGPADIAKRLTWTPRGALVDGTPVRRLALGSTSATRAPIRPGLDHNLVTVLRDAVDQRRDVPSYWPTEQGVPHNWDIEVAAITRADGVRPLFQALVDEDPFARANGVNLVVLADDGYPTTIPVQLAENPGPSTILVSGDKSWADIVAAVNRARGEGRVPTLGVP